MIPVPTEKVQLYAQALHTKHDHIDGMPARIDKAAALLLSGEVTEDAGQFFVMSSRADGSGYTVTGGCTCPDYANGAPMLGAAPWCKHRLAVAMLKRHIRESAQPRIQIGDPGNTTRVPLIRGRSKSAYLYRVEEALTDFGQTTIRLTWSDRLFDFIPTNDADYIALARWLENAPPLPAPRRSIYDAWTADASANDAAIMPFSEWSQIYGQMYANLRQ